ncbi:hypothetical protein OK348_13585 [Flavobacterium sp. MXW15]|uniref:ASCH domain-containing protein n=1 Tax=Xanthomonas chitinilytica TaxID=2989819 RepID=A0ABT3JX04_9XANT|nr:hypothetical protein [Xanthomonas sp. H13-6]MCW4455817.1 hypothetical protein [Flavobacterium sp. MXW15]MCW4473032.1 hypothetical protein [Xanthomonas sp. H13-6]
MTLPEPPILEFRNPVFLPGRNTSVRRGGRWHGIREARLRLADGHLSPPRPLRTELKPFAALTGADLQYEHDPGCRSVAGLLAELQRLYPGFSAGEDVTLVHFTLE